MTTNRLAKSSEPKDDWRDIENMPGYVPPKQRKEWTPAQHCDFANRQLEYRRVNEDRKAKGLQPIHWIVSNGRVELAFTHCANAPTP
jgi:hypothetical protein